MLRRVSRQPSPCRLLRVRRNFSSAVVEPLQPEKEIQPGDMDVTRHNFSSTFDDVRAALLHPSCRFVAIDTEFTGLSTSESQKEWFLDTLEERYQKIKAAGESFLITQFGLSTVHVDESSGKDPEIYMRTWNFYIFPRPYGYSDHRFLCQASSLQFLSDHGFDFNKFIADGIPFVQLSKTTDMKKRLKRNIDNLRKVNKNMQLSEEGQTFQKEVEKQVHTWLDNGALNGETIEIPTRNSFFKMIVHNTVGANGAHLHSESNGNVVVVTKLTKEEKEEKINAKAQTMRDEMDDAIGFSRVIEAISESKKPVVGHNALLDFVYVFQQFHKPLPETMSAFKSELHELFPSIFDTKHLTLRSPLLSNPKLEATHLGSLFQYMTQHVTPPATQLLSSDPQFDNYRHALENAGDEKSKLLAHEAGFDAMMTAVCFLGLLMHDAQGEVNVDMASILPTEKWTERMNMVEEKKNQLNLMISDGVLLDLNNLEQRIDRSRVYRVSSAKRKIAHLKMDDVFPAAKVHRVVRDGNQEAFVVLEEPTEVEADAKSEVTVTPYDAYMDKVEEKAIQEKKEERKKLYQALLAEQAEVKEKESSMWDRCVIS